jgi:hypothetical protein
MTPTETPMTSKFYKKELKTDPINTARRERRKTHLAEVRLVEKNRRRALKGLEPLPLSTPEVVTTSIQQDTEALRAKILRETGQYVSITITTVTR